jgi:hypothetical protein
MNPQDRFPRPAIQAQSQIPIVGQQEQVPILTLQYQISEQMRQDMAEFKGEIPLEGLSLMNLIWSLGTCALHAMIQRDKTNAETTKTNGQTTEGTAQDSNLGAAPDNQTLA